MTVTALKPCTKCGERKDLKEFPPHNQQKDGRDTKCRSCKRAASRGYYKRWSPDQRRKHRARVLRSRYGIDLQTIDLLYEVQEGCCAICGTPGDKPASDEKRKAPKDVLSVDHDHETGRVRGLLCRTCNKGLGFFSDDVRRMATAISYLLREGDDLLP